MKKGLFAVMLALAVASFAGAWWDTWVRSQKSEPLLHSYNAAELEGADVIVDDEQAQGGRGGRVAAVEPGQSLTIEADLDHSVYSVWVIARADEAVYQEGGGSVERLYELPGGNARGNSPRPPVYVSLTVVRPDGEEQSWYMPVAFRNDYRIVSKLYFPLHVGGNSSITVGLDERSEFGLLFDRIEIRDVLGDVLRQPIKTQRVFTTDAELEAMRAEGFDRNRVYTIGRMRIRHQLPLNPLTVEERVQRSDEIWDWAPDINMMTGDPQFNHWHNVIGRDSPGVHADLAGIYERTGDADAGMDAAVLLISIAEKYPSLDHYYTEMGQYGQIAAAGALTWGSRGGKTVYSGWAGGDLSRLASSYDKVFDFVKGSQELADYVNTRITWVQTPDDVIELLDSNILQHGIDVVNRDVIRSPGARSLCIQALGVDLGDNMPDAPIYHVARILTEDPSDGRITGRSRGDVTYIGSTFYVGEGSPTGYLRIAGGFPLMIGDAGDLRRGRVDGPSYPSRVYEGFGAAIMEAGQELATPLLKRGFGVFTGIGRGHSHQDTLNIEIFAHGVRLAPGLGGRHEGNLRASPNMRWNRMKNLVWVDFDDFRNIYPGSTTSGTGWTESFSPQPGSQYTSNAARATSHKQVDLYQRSTAMIDGEITDEKADMYIFDVFRVRGGADHVYAFHGAYSQTFEANVELEPADENDPVTTAVLDRRMDKDPMQGPSADPLVVTWPLRPGLQAGHQGRAGGEPVGLTLTLFDRGNDRVFVGGAESDAYPVDMPYLHVYSGGEEGRSSVYPAIMEPHAGERFIVESELLTVAPQTDDAERGVAVRVVTAQGRTDTLFSSLKPAELHTVDGDMRVRGEFGFVSEDEDGLASAHLVGGTELTKGGLSIRLERPVYSAVIENVDYNRRELTLGADLPAGILDKSVALIGNEYRREAWNLDSVGGRKAWTQNRISYYQANIESIDQERGVIYTDLEPDVYGADTEHTIGTSLANTTGDHAWRTAYQPEERWMYLGWPNTDLSYPRTMTLNDLPDVDGDGRRTLRMVNRGDDENTLLELEVTRVDPENFTFYFKMPENHEYQIGGWQFANRELINEDGSKRWLATFPGTVNAWKLEDADDLTLDIFPEVEGRRKVRAYLFGAGDELSIKTFVHVARTDGGYEVRSNSACVVTLPGRAPVAITEEALALADGVITIE